MGDPIQTQSAENVKTIPQDGCQKLFLGVLLFFIEGGAYAGLLFFLKVDIAKIGMIRCALAFAGYHLICDICTAVRRKTLKF